MALKNKSMYSILGILNVSTGTGYDIKKYCDTVLPGIWNENYGHIYPTLRMLAEEEFVEILDPEPDSKKIRYAITEKGRAELRTWLLAETELQPARSEFMLKFLFSSDLPHDQARTMLDEYRMIHEKKLAMYRAMERSLKAGIAEISNKRSFYLDSVLQCGIIACEGMIRWCSETSERLGK